MNYIGCVQEITKIIGYNILFYFTSRVIYVLSCTKLIVHDVGCPLKAVLLAAPNHLVLLRPLLPFSKDFLGANHQYDFAKIIVYIKTSYWAKNYPARESNNKVKCFIGSNRQIFL